jgi:hypothetical protein
MKNPLEKWYCIILLLCIFPLSIGCKTLSSSNNTKTYYTYDSKYGGYPTGRIEKQGNTYYIYDSNYGGYPTGRIEKKGNTYYQYKSKYGGYPIGKIQKK